MKEKQKEPQVIPLMVGGMSRESLIKFQLLVTVFINGITLTISELKTLVLLGLRGEQTLLSFSQELADYKIFASSGSARNTIAKLVDYHLILKSGKGKKRVSLISSIDTGLNGAIILDIKALYDPSGT